MWLNNSLSVSISPIPTSHNHSLSIWHVQVHNGHDGCRFFRRYALLFEFEKSRRERAGETRWKGSWRRIRGIGLSGRVEGWGMTALVTGTGGQSSLNRRNRGVFGYFIVKMNLNQEREAVIFDRNMRFMFGLFILYWFYFPSLCVSFICPDCFNGFYSFPR